MKINTSFEALLENFAQNNAIDFKADKKILYSNSGLLKLCMCLKSMLSSYMYVAHSNVIIEL